MRKIIPAVLLLSGGPLSWTQNCGWTGPLSLPPNTIDTLTLTISDHQLNDLADPGQGLCGIDLAFSHDRAQELEITLLSPGGQSVVLVGPVFTAAPGNSALSTWRVKFNRCSGSTRPDPGHLPQWNHLQHTYLIGGDYRGVYHPHAGCLEDLDTGPVNGEWKLVLRNGDGSGTRPGILQGVRLYFCDPGGVDCCRANAGTIGGSGPFELCAGDPFPADSLSPRYTYPVFPPDPARYGYTLLVHQGPRLEPVPADLGELPPGSYWIQGLSYALEDSATLNQLLDDLPFPAFRDSLELQPAPVCAALSVDSLRLLVRPPPDTTFLQVRICKGDSVRIGMEYYSAPGEYRQQLRAANGCDSVLVTRLEWASPEILLSSPDTLTCENGRVALDAGASDFGPMVRARWSGPAGRFFPSDSARLVFVDQPGIYTLRLLDLPSGCANTGQVEVVGDTARPRAAILPVDPIDCERDSVLIDASASRGKGPLSFSWYYQGALIDGQNEDRIRVGQSGIYRVQVSSLANGCSDSLEFRVEEAGRRIESLDWQLEAQSCEYAGAAELQVTAVKGGNPPYRFFLDGQDPAVDGRFTDLSPGSYVLSLRDRDGCTYSETITVPEVVTPTVELGPDLEIEQGEEVELRVRVDGPLDSLRWVPAGGSVGADPLVRTYRPEKDLLVKVVATSPFGCTAEDAILIKVVPPELVFLPTAFSPNGDGNNDRFFVQAAPEVDRVIRFAIYDRWGNRVFSIQDILPNDPSGGWDGRRKGQLLNTGLYLYQLEIAYGEDRTQKIQGEVLLLGGN